MRTNGNTTTGRPVHRGLSVSAIWVLFAVGQGPGQAAQYTTVFAESEREVPGEKIVHM